MKEIWVVCLLALLLKHMCLGVSNNTESGDITTNKQALVTSSLNETETVTTYSTASSKDPTTKQTLPLTSLVSSTISTQSPVLQQSTQRTIISVTTTFVQQTNSLVVTKPTRKTSIPVVTKNLPKTIPKRKNRGLILLIVLVVLCGVFVIFACVIPYLKKKIKLSKLRHHLVPVYSFEPGEGEDWETELLTEHRDKEGQQTGGTTTRATIVREVPQLRLSSDSSYTV